MSSSELSLSSIEDQTFSDPPCSIENSSRRRFKFGLVGQLVATACLGSFMMAYQFSVMNTALLHISVDLEFGNHWRGAAISTAVYVGAAVGALSFGRLNGIGCRCVLIIAAIMFIIGAVSNLVATSFLSLLWARMLNGLAAGITSCATPKYIAEITPKETRGRYGVIHNLLAITGGLGSVLVGLGLTPLSMDTEEGEMLFFDQIWWRVMLGSSVVPAVLLLLLLMFVHTKETPFYYIGRGRIDEARDVLVALRNTNDVSDELNMIQSEIDASSSKSAASRKSAFIAKEYRRVLVVGSLLAVFQKIIGISAFVALSNKIFDQAGLGQTWQTALSAGLYCMAALVTFPACYLIDKLGRKTLLLIGTVGQCVSIALSVPFLWVDEDGTATQIVSIVSIYLFFIFFFLGYGPILSVALFEMFPLEIKKSAEGFCIALNWMAGILTVFVAGCITSNREVFTILMGTNVLSVLIVKFLMLETKGRNILDSPYMK